jgi:AmmeMemoRadiSam system protein B/AmmeMemoRadiSam system protein A
MAGGLNVKGGFGLGVCLLVSVCVASTARTQKDVGAMEPMVRKPAVAGQFYTPDPEELRREVTHYLDEAKPPAVSGDIVAIVAPHAGYMYSGQVAAYGYRLVRGKKYDTVVVISPSHTEYFPYASVFPGTAYETPLGRIPVDTGLASVIGSKSDLVRSDMKGHEVGRFQRSEHALEVQLPFLQVALGTFSLVPIVMGDQSSETVEALGAVLGEALAGRNVLIVASTDLSHFYSAAKARTLDGEFQKRLRDFDPDKLMRDLARKGTEACGGGPVAAAMIAARKLGATACDVLDYANSGDVTGDSSNVVGYVSAVMVKEKRARSAGSDSNSRGGSSKRDPSASASTGGAKAQPSASAGAGGAKASSSTSGAAELTREDKIFLLTLARQVIEAECAGKRFKSPVPPSLILKEPRGAFVTLHEDGQLRGCIGYIEAVKPLATTIEEMAKAAAFSDWRFSPVRAEEVPRLELEISVLSPITEVTDPSTIVVGKHGLIITRGMNRGLLLPQVPTEWKWDRETFLAQTCVKAGLAQDAWKNKGTKIECFTADVFSEKELGLHRTR